MDLDKIYKDSLDIERNILWMIQHEPEWAANRIQAGEKDKADLTKLREGVRGVAERLNKLDCVMSERALLGVAKELATTLEELSQDPE